MFMAHITCRLTAKNRNRLWNPMLGSQVWATFTFTIILPSLWVIISWALLHFSAVSSKCHIIPAIWKSTAIWNLCDLWYWLINELPFSWDDIVHVLFSSLTNVRSSLTRSSHVPRMPNCLMNWVRSSAGLMARYAACIVISGVCWQATVCQSIFAVLLET